MNKSIWYVLSGIAIGVNLLGIFLNAHNQDVPAVMIGVLALTFIVVVVTINLVSDRKKCSSP